MQIELSGQAQKVLEKLLAGGKFASADEAVECALGFYEECRPGVESLKSQLQEGLDDLAAGRVASYESDEELKAFFDDVKRQGRERLAGNNGE